MSTCYMMIGLPASGKSSYVKRNFPGLPVISTDDIINEYASERNLSYSDVFLEYIGEAEKIAYLQLAEYINTNSDFVWDQTNLSVPSRKKKISMLPDTYKVVAVYIEAPPEALLKKRLFDRSVREGKYIPDEVVTRMKSQLEFPSLQEGFSEIIVSFYGSEDE